MAWIRSQGRSLLVDAKTVVAVLESEGKFDSVRLLADDCWILGTFPNMESAVREMDDLVRWLDGEGTVSSQSDVVYQVGEGT